MSLQGSSGLRRTSEIIEIARTSSSYIPVSDFLFDRDLRTQSRDLRALGNAESSSVSSTEIVFWTDVSLCSVYYPRGRHHKRYNVIAITLRYVFVLKHKALYLWKIVIASNSYRFRLFADVITFENYRSELAVQCYRFTSLSL